MTDMKSFKQSIPDEMYDQLEEQRKHQYPGVSNVQELLRIIIIPRWIEAQFPVKKK